MSAGEQARAALYMMALGAILGAVYDALTLFCRAAKAGRILTGMLDLLLGAAAGVTAAALYLRISPYRLYAFAGVTAGIAAYFVTIGAIVRYLYHKGRKMCRKS
ncbi:MAG: spore cortex biosynthesis protein YabQ [Christensenellales bacterium]